MQRLPVSTHEQPDQRTDEQVAVQVPPGFWSGPMRATQAWLASNTFVPPELQRRGVRPIVGYAVAMALPLLAATADAALVYVFPRLAFLGLLEVLAVVAVALGWGAGPSLMATVVGAGLIYGMVLSPHFAWDVTLAEDVAGVGLFLAVGGALSIITGRLERARRVAQAASAEMDEMISVVSHELRQPLTGIKGGLQLMQRRLAKLRAQSAGSGAAPAQDDCCDAVASLIPETLRQTTLLNRLVDDLLDASRIRTRRLAVRMETCDLVEIARLVVAEQRLAWPHRQIVLVDDTAGGLAVRADADRIGQALRNYLTNALKYSPPERPVTMALRCERGLAYAEVRDIGPGLSPSQQRRIWERFQRAPGIRALNGEGTGLGLGLHITREIVEQHGGQVGMESAPGCGSAFWLALPLAEPSERALVTVASGHDARAE